ncbi:MAG: hypothetical protein CVV27_02505 [Candidatus Melainabacteria bacterium HGW-Melainabacteria-1]|nr:MAG: hypothetical protein CVV27_02505 [Candidatus Melainabacteria bacterium HGW-Melainabacteria-1]
MSQSLTKTHPQALQLYLWPLCWDAWQAAGSLRSSLHEFTDYPLPAQSPAAELQWWHSEVETGQMQIAGLFQRSNDCLIGTLKAFSFSPDRSRCEIGIELLDPEHYGRGFGHEGLSLWLLCLKDQGVTEVFGLIHPDNARSLRFFERQGFRRIGLEADSLDPQMHFVRVEKALA